MLLAIGCNQPDESVNEPEPEATEFISAADISAYPEIDIESPTFYDANDEPVHFLTALKDNGINTLRLRLWVNPMDDHSGFEEVSQFSALLKDMGFKIWLTIHYSDTWADPGHQETPAEWQDLSYAELVNRVKSYTELVIGQIQPEYVQLGNEVNSGFLFPEGNLIQNPSQFLELQETAIAATRAESPDSKIIMHYAGIEGSDWFYDQVKDLDYDIIGLSYYPKWHGKSLITLRNQLSSLGSTHDKDVVVAETSYPFTLGWNDWTHNVIGLEEQLILPDYPATPEGQQEFIREIKSMTEDLQRGIGFLLLGS